MKLLRKIVFCFVLPTATASAIMILTSCSKEEVKNIQNLTYDGSTVSWDAIPNAKNYKYSINGGETKMVSNAENKIAVQYDSKGENFTFEVEAVMKGKKENPKFTINFENIGQVKNLKIVDGELKWDSIDNADKYQIKYNGNVVTSFVGTTSYVASPGEFKYQVRALKTDVNISDGNNPYYSSWSEALSGKILETVDDLKYDSEIFTWGKVADASGYIIKLGNDEFETKTNSYEYSAGNQDFDIQIKAIGDEKKNIYDSSFSSKKKYQYIAPIDTINVENGNLVWNQPNNAIRYKIKINGIVQDEELDTNTYTKLTSGQSYRIQILPLGTSDFFFSHWSNEITINILRSPVVSYGDNVIKWNQVAGAEGYELKIVKDNETLLSQTLGNEVFVYDYAFEKAGSYEVYVKATTLGNSGVYESKWSVNYPVKRLVTPSGVVLTNRPLEQNQVNISFNPITGATGYKLYADDIEIATSKKDSNFSVDLSKLTNRKDESKVNFSIKAMGGVTSQGAVLDTNELYKFQVTKLATPQNLIINGSQLQWDNVPNTSKYVLTIDGKRTELTSTYFTLTDLAAGEHSIYVQSMGNGEDTITSSFSNALKVKKLQTPTNLTVTDGLLKWDVTPGATAYKVILGTETFNADGNQFDLKGYDSYIKEGTGNQISVYAIGNGSDVIDSDVSSTLTISKYSRPSNIKIQGDSLVWNTSSYDSISATSYKLIIKKDGVENTQIVNSNSCQLSSFEEGEYEIKVVALGDNQYRFDSPISESYSFVKLPSIKEVKKENNTYSWDEISGASGYEIKLSRDSQWISLDTNSYTPTFNTEGQFEVSIRAIGNNVNVASSSIYSFTQRVQRITQPVLDESLRYDNSFKVEKEGNKIRVTINKNTNSKDYKLFVGSIERDNVVSENDSQIVYEFTMTTQGASYIVQVQCLGNEFDNGIYYLDSNLSTEVKVENK